MMIKIMMMPCHVSFNKYLEQNTSKWKFNFVDYMSKSPNECNFQEIISNKANCSNKQVEQKGRFSRNHAMISYTFGAHPQSSELKINIKKTKTQKFNDFINTWVYLEITKDNHQEFNISEALEKSKWVSFKPREALSIFQTPREDYLYMIETPNT